MPSRVARLVKIPPPPPGLPRRLRGWYVIIAAAASAIAAATVPMCPARDVAGRPLWRLEVVHDGDTVTCLDPEGRRHKVRLVGIDAPEHGQPSGDASRAALVAKLSGRGVRVDGDAFDQHGRLLGRLFVDERDINRELVAEGWAWAFGGFAPDPDLRAAEDAARRDHRGLWADPRPISPAEWRRLHPPHR